MAECLIELLEDREFALDGPILEKLNPLPDDSHDLSIITMKAVSYG